MELQGRVGSDGFGVPVFRGRDRVLGWESLEKGRPGRPCRD